MKPFKFYRGYIQNKTQEELITYSLEFSYPYMHDGRFKRLSEVLTHYTTTIQQGKTLSAQLQTPIVLTSNEKVDLIAFLLTLTDKHFLFNPDYSFPKEILLSLSKESK